MGGTLALSPLSILQIPLSSHTRRQTLATSNYFSLHTSLPWTVVRHPKDSPKYHTFVAPTEQAVITYGMTPRTRSMSTSTTNSIGPSSLLAGSSSDEEFKQHYLRQIQAKSGFTQLESPSGTAISLGTTPFSQSWGAISRLMSIITFLMFIYKLLS